MNKLLHRVETENSRLYLKFNLTKAVTFDRIPDQNQENQLAINSQMNRLEVLDTVIYEGKLEN